MAVAFGAIGAKSAGGTTTVDIPHPASVGAGNLLVAGRNLWNAPSGAFSAETGWTAGGELAGGTGTAADTHTCEIRADYREAAGGETGNVTFDQTGPPGGVIGVMARYTKGSGSWNIATAVGDDATHAADRSATSSTNLSLAPGDVLVAIAAVDTDAALTITSPTFTASGITFGTVNRRTSGAGVTTGNDGNLELFDVAVSTGTATVAVTLSFTTATTQCGPVSFIRLRETSGTQHAASGTVAATSDVSTSATLRAVAAGAVAATSAVAVAAGLLAPVSGSVPATSATSAASILAAAASGTVGASSAISASAARGTPAAGTASGTSAASGATALARPASGAPAATSGVSAVAQLLTPAAGTIAAATAIAGSSGPLLLAASGSVAGTTTLTGEVAALLDTSGLVQSLTTTAGGAVRQAPAQGDAPAASETVGAAGLIANTSGTVDAISTTEASPTALIGASGTTAAVTGSVGAADLVGGPATHPTIGTVHAVSSAIGAALLKAPTSGVTDGLSGASDAPTAQIAAVGQVEVGSLISGSAAILGATPGAPRGDGSATLRPAVASARTTSATHGLSAMRQQGAAATARVMVATASIRED